MFFAIGTFFLHRLRRCRNFFDHTSTKLMGMIRFAQHAAILNTILPQVGQPYGLHKSHSK